jgi:CHAD domain-containing protein
MEEIIEQMKGIQSRIGNVVDRSNQSNLNNQIKSEIVGGEGIEIKTDGNKVSISQQQAAQQAGITLPAGSGVLGINNGVLFVYETTECA